jgi:hypothetical protein
VNAQGMRRAYIIGRLGSYLTPTVEACDARLRLLAAMFRDAHLPEAKAARVWHDIDLILERRLELENL